MKLTTAIAIGILGSCLSVYGAVITVPGDSDIYPDGAGYGRQASLGSADAAAFGSDNPGAADIAGHFGGSWTNEGELLAAGVNDLLTIAITSGSWGQPVIEGTWSINPIFWTIYGQAVISMHVGHGRDVALNDPDHFAWLITPNTLSGTWSYDLNLGQGGGLSNIKLWGSGEPTTKVPDSASTMLLIGLGIAGLGVFARRGKA